MTGQEFQRLVNITGKAVRLSLAKGSRHVQKAIILLVWQCLQRLRQTSLEPSFSLTKRSKRPRASAEVLTTSRLAALAMA